MARAKKAVVVEPGGLAASGPGDAGRPDPKRRFYGPYRVGRPSAGVHVDEYNALAYSAVYGSVRVITSRMMQLTWKAARNLPSGDKDYLADHPIRRLLQVAPNPEMTAAKFIETVDHHRLTWGNGFAYIERDARFRIKHLWPVTPERVKLCRSESLELFYAVRTDDGEWHAVRPMDMLHVRNIGFDGLWGYSQVRLAREAIALGLATERFGGEFFGNGIHASGVLETDNELDDDEFQNLRKSFEAANAGPGAWQRPMILEAGLKWKQISIPPEDAQFLQTRQFQISDIGPRWFGVPLPFLGHHEGVTVNNMEQLKTMLVEDAIVPAAIVWEQECTAKLLDESEREAGVYLKLDVKGLLRGDMKTRAEFYDKMLARGVYSPNDVLRLEDQNGYEGGDERFLPSGTMTVEQVVSGAFAKQGSARATAEALRPVFVDAARRVLSRGEKATARAVKKYAGDEVGLAAWRAAFDEEQAAFFAEAFGPASAAYYGALGAGEEKAPPNKFGGGTALGALAVAALRESDAEGMAAVVMAMLGALASAA